MSDQDQASCDPTEKTLYEEPHDDRMGTWTDRLYQCGDGVRKGIGISDGCTTHVRSLKEWHELAVANFRLLNDLSALSIEKEEEKRKRWELEKENTALKAQIAHCRDIKKHGKTLKKLANSNLQIANKDSEIANLRAEVFSETAWADQYKAERDEARSLLGRLVVATHDFVDGYEEGHWEALNRQLEKLTPVLSEAKAHLSREEKSE